MFYTNANTMIVESIRSSIFYILLQTTTTAVEFVPALLSAEERIYFIMQQNILHNLY